MLVPKTQIDLKNLIKNEIEENIHLDYKEARALENTDGKKNEISKDVSAMANAGGGVIIYGIKEHNTKHTSHLPEEITPIDRIKISKEWLEQVIQSKISPKIEGLIIHPIALDSNSTDVVYVLEIPQSLKAHQASDKKYYKRNNFQSVPMEDYEIRDIFNRVTHPIIDLEFSIKQIQYTENNSFNDIPLLNKPSVVKYAYTLYIYPLNIGNVFAQYVNYFVEFPENLINQEFINPSKKLKYNKIECFGDNTYGGIYNPILPGLFGRATELDLVEHPILDDREISWIVHADNAEPKEGKIRLKDIPFKHIVKN